MMQFIAVAAHVTYLRLEIVDEIGHGCWHGNGRGVEGYARATIRIVWVWVVAVSGWVGSIEGFQDRGLLFRGG